MSIFDQLDQRNAQAMPPNANEALQRIKSDPAAFLQQRGLNVPAGMNNPQQIIQHLIQSGQVPNARLQQIMSMMGRR